MTKAVFFDAGGTLIHTDPRTWLPPVLELFGESADWSRIKEAILPAYAYYDEEHLKATDEERAKRLWYETDRLLLEGLGVKRAEEIARWLVENWRSPSLWPKTPGTPEVLAELKSRGLVLAVVSNWDVLLPEVLSLMGVSPYLDAVFVSAALGVKKPDPAIYERALAELGLSPEEVLFVGDRPDADYEVPRRLGMKALLVSPEEGIRPVIMAL